MTERTPHELKVMRGTERPDRPDTPAPSRSPAGAKVPDPPAFLDRDGKAQWRKLIGELARRRLLTTTVLARLELMCDVYAEWRREARATGRSASYERTGENGAQIQKRHPSHAAAVSARKEYAQHLEWYERLVSSVEPEEDKDPMEQLLERAGRGRSRATG